MEKEKTENEAKRDGTRRESKSVVISRSRFPNGMKDKENGDKRGAKRSQRNGKEEEKSRKVTSQRILLIEMQEKNDKKDLKRKP